MSDTFTCENCGETFDKTRSDEEAAAEAQELFPGIDVSDPEEAGVVCDDCFNHIMGRVREEAPELIGEGWRGDGVLVYDIVLPKWSEEPAWTWTPFRDNIPRATSCYRMGNGSMVHVKPGCRCPR